MHQIEYHDIMGVPIFKSTLRGQLHREHTTGIHQMATPSLMISVKRALLHGHPSLLISIKRALLHGHPSLLISIKRALLHGHPSLLISIKRALLHGHPSFLISIKRALLHGHPSLLLSIKMASETFKIWLIYITIPLYSFFTYNGYFIIIIQFIAYIYVEWSVESSVTICRCTLQTTIYRR